MDERRIDPLQMRSSRRGIAGSEPVATRDLRLGTWSLAAAALSDRHQHEEINYVLEGELHVTWGGATYVAGEGALVVVPPGELARYEAPVFARMLYIYGPSKDGHAATDVSFEDLSGA